MSTSFNPWICVPFVGIALAVGFNVAMVTTAKRVHPTKVEDHPYAASSLIDADKERRAAFMASGCALNLSADASVLHASLMTPASVIIGRPATLALWRPDDPSGDFTVAWPDPRHPLSISLPRPGRWRVRLELPSAGNDATGMRHDAVVDTLP